MLYVLGKEKTKQASERERERGGERKEEETIVIYNFTREYTHRE